jgi:Na+-driven multidrug efflux pump
MSLATRFCLRQSQSITAFFWKSPKPDFLFMLKSAAAPVLALYCSWLLMASIGIVDLLLAGYIDKDAQAALGVSDQILFLTMLAMSGLAAGVNTCMCQALGAQDDKLAGTYKRAGLMITVLFGLLATVLGFSFSHWLAKLFCANEQAVAHASLYIKLCALANLPWAIVQYQGAVLRATGQSRYIAQQWLLITAIAVGPGSFAFFYLPGAKSLMPIAVAWIAASLAGCLFGHASLERVLREIPKHQHSLSETFCRGQNILKIGIPVLLTEFGWLLSNLLLYCLLAKLPDGASAQAAWTIKLKVEETVSYAPLLAGAMATATTVGHQVGAGKEADARKIARSLATIFSAVMLTAGCLTAYLAPLIVPQLTSDEQAAKLSQTLLVSAILTYPLNAVATILTAACEGAGKTVVPMVINITGFFFIRFPLAWLLMAPMAAGTLGVLAAKVVSLVFIAFAMILAFKRMPWSSLNAGR